MFAGIDACGGGWIAVMAEGQNPLRLTGAAVRKTFAQIMDVTSAATAIGVDIPIGLADRDFRVCDLRAREIMGRFKFKVFKTSPRPVIEAATVAERHRLHRELTGQGLPPPAAAFVPKVAQVNDWMLANGKPQDRVFEVHPELCFKVLNDGSIVEERKHDDAGVRVRHNLLQPFFGKQHVAAWVRMVFGDYRRSDLHEDDILDAMVACVTAATWTPEATIPSSTPPMDAFGLRMEMRCPRSRGTIAV